MARLVERAALAELQQAVTAFGFARHGHDVAVLQPVSRALERVHAGVALLEQHALLVVADDRGLFHREGRSGFGGEHLFERGVGARHGETLFGELDVVDVAGRELQRGVVDAGDTGDRAAFVGRNGFRGERSVLYGADFIRLAVEGLHRDVALVARTVPRARFACLGLRVLDLHVLRFVRSDLVGRDDYRIERFDVLDELRFVVGRNLEQTVEELRRGVRERNRDHVARLEGVVALADFQGYACSALLRVIGDIDDEGLLVSPPLVRYDDTLQALGPDFVGQVGFVAARLVLQHEAADFGHVRLRAFVHAARGLLHGAFALVGDAHVPRGRYRDDTRARRFVGGNGHFHRRRTLAARGGGFDPVGVGFDLPVDLAVEFDFELFGLRLGAVEEQRLRHLDLRDRGVVVRVVVRTRTQTRSQRQHDSREERPFPKTEFLHGYKIG